MSIAEQSQDGSAVDLGNTISVTRTGGKLAMKYQVQNGGIFSKDIRHWDIAPTPEYFAEIARISKNQIIWGGNYFGLPPTRCFIVWDKKNISENFTMSMCEYAWTSFNDNAKIFGCIPQNSNRFHPTAKPKALYDFVFRHFAKPGMKILDPYLGQGYSRIAAYEAGLDFEGIELDKTYYDLHTKMWDEYQAQLSLFDNWEELTIET